MPDYTLTHLDTISLRRSDTQREADATDTYFSLCSTNEKKYFSTHTHKKKNKTQNYSSIFPRSRVTRQTYNQLTNSFSNIECRGGVGGTGECWRQIMRHQYS